MGGIDIGALIRGLNVWLDCFPRFQLRDTECKMLSVRRPVNCGELM